MHNVISTAAAGRVRARLFGCALLILGAAGPWPDAGVVRAQSIANPKLDAALQAALSQAPPGTPIEVVIVFTDLAAAPRVQALAGAFHLLQVLPMAGAVLPADQIAAIAEWPEIYSITFNAPLKRFLHESVQVIGADDVWTTYHEVGGNPNVAVAVVDSGIDGTHPDLAFGSKVVQNVKVLPFLPAVEDQPLTDSTSGHGTHVAGTIGGSGAVSGGYYRGVAPGVRLIGLGAGEADRILTAAEAYDWVLRNHARYGIRVVSNSWGSTGGDINLRNPIAIATLAAYKQGILSVFAAGNDGGYDVMNPYSLPPWVLSVAAGRKDGPLADFSSRGRDGDHFKHPDLTAPGVDIYAARSKTVGITATDPWPNPVNPLWTASYTALSGTSMATPHVSGAAALLLSNNPKLSPDQVIDLLTQTTTPMPGYALHEAGRGYLNVLAAYEASRKVTGNLDEFLAGKQRHTEKEVVGVLTKAAYVELEFTGTTLVGAADFPEIIDHPFQVSNGTSHVDIQLTWEPQIQDAFDMEVLDPQGRVVVSSGNGAGMGEAALFVPESTGEYILRLHPFAGAGATYKAIVRIARGGSRHDKPPAYDYYAGIVNVYKTYGVVGIVADYFRSGDRGFIVFTLAAGDGLPLEGQAANLRAVYTDRLGRVGRLDEAIADRGGGEYSTSFNTGAAAWTAAPGPVTVSLVWVGDGSMRALGTGFKFNALATSLQIDGGPPRAGQPLAFSGSVAQRTSVATGVVDTTPLAGATVAVRLLGSTGQVLGSATVTSDLEGQYRGSVVVPITASGTATLEAEAAYRDPAIVLGPPDWYGRAAVRCEDVR